MSPTTWRGAPGRPAETPPQESSRRHAPKSPHHEGTTRLDDDYTLAVALTEDPARTEAIIRSAYRWGYGRGWLAGYDRSFAPPRWRANVPSYAELRRRRGETPDGHTLPRPGDWLPQHREESA